jgi:hypothetical protein
MRLIIGGAARNPRITTERLQLTPEASEAYVTQGLRRIDSGWTVGNPEIILKRASRRSLPHCPFEPDLPFARCPRSRLLARNTFRVVRHPGTIPEEPTGGLRRVE